MAGSGDGPLGVLVGSSVTNRLQASLIGIAAWFLLALGLDLVVSNSIIGESQKTFTARSEDPFYPPASEKVPTVFGKNDPVHDGLPDT